MFCWYLCVTREGSTERGAMIIGHLLLWDVETICVYMMSFSLYYFPFKCRFGRLGFFLAGLTLHETIKENLM